MCLCSSSNSSRQVRLKMDRLLLEGRMTITMMMRARRRGEVSWVGRIEESRLMMWWVGWVEMGGRRLVLEIKGGMLEALVVGSWVSEMR